MHSRQWNEFLRNGSTQCLLVFLTEPRSGTTSKMVDLSCGTVCLQSISHRKTDDAKSVQHTTVHYGPRLCNRIFGTKEPRCTSSFGKDATVEKAIRTGWDWTVTRQVRAFRGYLPCC